MGENYNVCWVRDWSNAEGVDRKGPLKKDFQIIKKILGASPRMAMTV